MTKTMIGFWSGNASKDSSLPKIERSVKNINIFSIFFLKKVESGNFQANLVKSYHVPFNQFCCKERGNFHVPCDKAC